MAKFLTFLFLSIVGYVASLQAQTLTRSGFNSGSGNNNQLTFTLGDGLVLYSSLMVFGSQPGEGLITSTIPLKVITPFRIYPNPFQNQVTIELATSQSAGVLKLLDVTGKLVYHSPITSSGQTLDIPSISPGMYMAEFVSGGKRELVKISKML